jgi:hypothetical protein
MDENLQRLFKGGKKLLMDTKARKPVTEAPKKGKIPPLGTPGNSVETDPHKGFVKRCIQEKPKKTEMIKDIERLIQMDEERLI